MDLFDYFAEHFGTENILPIGQVFDGVISKLPEAQRAKIPSVFNSYGELVGYKGWQTGKAKPSDIQKWKADKRYGFGLRLGFPIPTGGVAICIDVDTENLAHQKKVERILKKILGVDAIPMRTRANSNRRAYLVIVDTDAVLAKVVLTLRKAIKAEGIKGEAVEILANGQQFAVYGRHPSGADLEWLNAPANSYNAEQLLPHPSTARISMAKFEQLMATLREELPIVEDTTLRVSQRNAESAGDVPADDVALYLDKEGWTLSTGKDGRRNIRSPFAHEYSAEQGAGDTSVTYFLPGTHGYEQGHFKSQHASDADKTDGDFLNAIGFIAAQFELIPASSDASASARPKLQLVLSGMHAGKREASLENLFQALTHPDWLKISVRYDEFIGDMVIYDGKQWVKVKDGHQVQLRRHLEAQKNFAPVSRDMMRDVLQLLANYQKFDSAQEWLTGLKWDGVKRVESFLVNYFSTEDTTYARALARYMWTALAGRVMEPGCQADMMPIFVGEQGCGKSRGVAAIAPTRDMFTDSVSFRDDANTQSRMIVGKLVCEFAEMSGFRKQDVEPIKAMITRTTEEFNVKYVAAIAHYPRRAVFFGTSNEPELLSDATGARRFLPINVGKVRVADIRRDREQLWAEALQLFVEGGIAFEAVTDEVAKAGIHDQFRVADIAEEILLKWLHEVDDTDGSSPASRNRVFGDAALLALMQGGASIRMDQGGKNRLGAMMRALGFESVQQMVGGKRMRFYQKRAL